ncbi:MAG TPA: NAD(P)-dependent oxidoreductase, partial [Verrucomicrobiae bacterium]|nr:NAD(P)-dependent oxidoreductase [Verrucomicrobiae bacterium]
MKIGFIGLGIMGSRMAANLQKRGHSLIVYNRTPEKAGQLRSEGAVWADSPASLATQVEIVFTMLAHPEAVKQAALGVDGFLSKLAVERLWVDCSTVNPSFSREMAIQARARGLRFLDAPVTGSKSQAALGNLAFWVGGEPADLEACRTLLMCMGNGIVHCGGHGMGASMKMVMNQLLGT